MKRACVAVLALALIGIGALVACDASSTGNPLTSAASVTLSKAVAQEPGAGKGCSIIGSWMTTLTPKFGPPDASDLNIPWLATMNGQSEHSGTIVTTVPLWPVDLSLSGAVRVTDLRGVWVRTGANTFKFTQIGWGVDALGLAKAAFRNIGTTTVVDDCSVLEVVSTMEALDVDLSLKAALPLPTMTAYRIVIPPPTD